MGYFLDRLILSRPCLLSFHPSQLQPPAIALLLLFYLLFSFSLSCLSLSPFSSLFFRYMWRRGKCTARANDGTGGGRWDNERKEKLVTGSRWPPHSAALLLSAELPSVAPAAHMRRILPSYNYFFFLWLAIVIITYILQKSFGRALRNALLMWAGGKRWRAERAPDTHNTETGDWTTAATFPRCRIYLSRSYKTDQETKKKKKKKPKDTDICDRRNQT
jgi:hypothetical protein